MKLLRQTCKSKWIACAMLAGSIFALNVDAENPASANQETAPSPNWQLATDDTSLTLAVVNNRPAIYGLTNPAQGWNWTPVHTEFPLLGRVIVSPDTVSQVVNWKFQDATVDESNGKKVTLRFTSTAPKMELKSTWWARKGPGPVEDR
jgi:hypothetical protein